jgi:hypothetical protein
MSSGEEKAWETLRGLEPLEVQNKASVGYDAERGCYLLGSLGMDVSICPGEKVISTASPEAAALIGRLSYFFNHAALWYLVKAKDIALTGRLLRPSDLRGGEFFFTGTHELPLGGIAAKYGRDGDFFIRRALELGGRALDLGDASAELRLLPRVPVTLILWLQDEEFPARADLLFDSSAELQVPLDICWSTAMLSLIPML